MGIFGRGWRGKGTGLGVAVEGSAGAAEFESFEVNSPDGEDLREVVLGAS